MFELLLHGQEVLFVLWPGFQSGGGGDVVLGGDLGLYRGRSGSEQQGAVEGGGLLGDGVHESVYAGTLFPAVLLHLLHTVYLQQHSQLSPQLHTQHPPQFLTIWQ